MKGIREKLKKQESIIQIIIIYLHFAPWSQLESYFIIMEENLTLDFEIPYI